MDKHALSILEYEKVRELLVSYSASGLGRAIISQLRPLRSRLPNRAVGQVSPTETRWSALCKRAAAPFRGRKLLRGPD